MHWMDVFTWVALVFIQKFLVELELYLRRDDYSHSIAASFFLVMSLSLVLCLKSFVYFGLLLYPFICLPFDLIFDCQPNFLYLFVCLFSFWCCQHGFVSACTASEDTP